MDKLIFRAFKSKGLSVSGDAVKALTSVLVREDDEEGSLRVVLDEIKSRIERREITSTLINVDNITSIVADLSSSEEDLAMESMQLLNAFSSPKIIFDERQKSYSIEANPPFCLHGPIESRARMYRERLQLVQQRLLRSGLFSQRGISSSGAAAASVAGGGGGGGGGAGKEVHELATIESLLGSKGQRVLLGMLTQPEEGVWHLEDLGASIRLDFSNALAMDFLYTEGSIVTVQGELSEYDSTRFAVHVMGMPHAEEREKTLTAMSITDPFGNNTRPPQWKQMEALEADSSAVLIIILSDVTFARPSVCEQLKRVFEGFEDTDSIPLFVLMGPFLVKDYSAPGGRQAATAAFAAFADTLASCPRLAAQAKFLLVPGPRDPGTASALPRRPIPESLTSDLRKKIKHLTLASNPCRVRFYTQEIVFFREDLLKKMQVG